MKKREVQYIFVYNKDSILLLLGKQNSRLEEDFVIVIAVVVL